MANQLGLDDQNASEWCANNLSCARDSWSQMHDLKVIILHWARAIDVLKIDHGAVKFKGRIPLHIVDNSAPGVHLFAGKGAGNMLKKNPLEWKKDSRSPNPAPMKDEGAWKLIRTTITFFMAYGAGVNYFLSLYEAGHRWEARALASATHRNDSIPWQLIIFFLSLLVKTKVCQNIHRKWCKPHRSSVQESRVSWVYRRFLHDQEGKKNRLRPTPWNSGTDNSSWSRRYHWCAV